MKNIIVDGQLLQTSAWHRGMGKYTVQVLQELDKNAPADSSISVMFNANLAHDSERYETLKYLCPNIQQLHYDLPLAGGSKHKIDEYKSKLSAYIAADFDEGDNFFLETSLFLFDFFAEFPDNCHKLLLFYDLTPLIFWKDLGGYFPPELYMARFKQLLVADHIFAISETTRQDLLNIFGLDPETITNINGGFTKIAEKTRRPQAFTVPKTFTLLPTGDLPHKNNDVAVAGFEAYRLKHAKGAYLLVTSHFSEASKQRLQGLSDHIIFTDNVADEELGWLYEHAGSVLFASKYEGLGMPVLDAVANKKPVVTSNIPVFKEMSDHAFYYFDTADPGSLAKALAATSDKKSFESKLKHYAAVMEKYAWSSTAQDVRKAIDDTNSLIKDQFAESTGQKRRIAVACLHPGIADQIGRLAEVLYQGFSEKGAVDYYFDANGTHYRDMDRPTFLDFFDCGVYDIAQLNIDAYRQYDAVVYLLDDKALPSRVAQRAFVLPGIVVAQDMPDKTGVGMEFANAIKDTNHMVSLKTAGSFEDRQRLLGQIQTGIEKILAAPNPQQVALRGRGSNRSIIKKLEQYI